MTITVQDCRGWTLHSQILVCILNDPYPRRSCTSQYTSIIVHRQHMHNMPFSRSIDIHVHKVMTSFIYNGTDWDCWAAGQDGQCYVAKEGTGWFYQQWITMQVPNQLPFLHTPLMSACVLMSVCLFVDFTVIECKEVGCPRICSG